MIVIVPINIEPVSLVKLYIDPYSFVGFPVDSLLCHNHIVVKHAERNIRSIGTYKSM